MKKSKAGFALLLSTVLAAGAVPPAAASVPESSPASACCSGGAPEQHEDTIRWLGSWYASMTPADDPGTISGDGFTDTTVRQSVHLSVGGDSLRLRISNAYGTTPLEVGAVTVAPGNASAEVEADQLTPVTFNGSGSTTIPAGADWISDPVPLAVEANSDLVVSMHLPGPTGPATTHPLGMSTSYRADGDRTSAGTDEFTPLDEGRYFLGGVDVTSPAKGSVIFFGDSITDGHSSTVDANLRYPDQVADRLLERPVLEQCGVVNSGISGNRLLEDAGPEGVSAMARFDSDVLARQNVDTVVLLEGINDIGQTDGEVPAEELIGVYRQFIDRSRDHGLRVVGATLTPYTGADYATEMGEETRQEVNDWIRNSGEFDDVVDFDATLRDPADPERILPDFDPGDHLHPNDQGYAAMAEAVDLDSVC
ncbi:SGNH/GDSL hydrolase family protein [Kocuria coralli]|uniref:SGNH/GDSL hydrolase family protein n=1 Tax=Kocuria coralli TaxID=1461025 RepID=A0A5J5L310_9MICC|nr:SGNH/GDSL hydrolase family protein [Kocuria coralli]KAA9395476.1 SGNH/GDSL hydrolase family protein [Kocuria coralli]